MPWILMVDTTKLEGNKLWSLQDKISPSTFELKCSLSYMSVDARTSIIVTLAIVRRLVAIGICGNCPKTMVIVFHRMSPLAVALEDQRYSRQVMCPIMTSGAPGATGATSDPASYDFEWPNMFVQDILVKGLLFFWARRGDLSGQSSPNYVLTPIIRHTIAHKEPKRQRIPSPPRKICLAFQE